MAKRFSRKVTKKRIFRLNINEANEIIRKEFIDSRGNRMRMILDAKIQKPNQPTIEWNREYNKD